MVEKKWYSGGVLQVDVLLVYQRICNAGKSKRTELSALPDLKQLPFFAFFKKRLDNYSEACIIFPARCDGNAVTTIYYEGRHPS